MVASLFVVFFFLFIALGSLDSSSESNSEGKPHKLVPSKNKLVTYEVECNCSDGCDLTYSNKTGGTNQTSISEDWKYSYKANPRDFLYISAQLQGIGLVRTKIYIGGVLFQESTTNSEYGIASVSGSVPR